MEDNALINGLIAICLSSLMIGNIAKCSWLRLTIKRGGTMIPYCSGVDC